MTVIAALLLMLPACKGYMDDGKDYQVFASKMIDEFLESEPDLSQFHDILLASDYEGMLHGYGSYTCFAPNNSAVSEYLRSLGKSSVRDLTLDECNALIQYHVIRDSIATSEFEDGRLPSPTIAGPFLTSKSHSDAAGNVWITINRQGRLLQTNFSAGNGIVHTCDAVLTPPQLGVFETLEQQYPDSLFSIMKHFMKYSTYSPDSVEARKEAGLDPQTADWYTMLVQDNQSFKDLAIGIENVDLNAEGWEEKVDSCLLVRLHVNQKDVDEDEELLRQFADYHLAPSLNYVADLLKIPTMMSCVNNQVMSVTRNVDQIIINYFVIGATIEPGVGLYRDSEFSDMSCSNGVIHYLGGQIEVKNRSSYRVNFDLADQPEIQALKNFRTADGSYTPFEQGSLSRVQWGGGTTSNQQIGYQQYTNYGNTLDTKVQYVYGDAMRFRFSPNINAYFEWKLPLLVEGKYKLWICWRREQTTTFRTVFQQEGKDDQVMPYVYDLGQYMNTTLSPEELLQTGWKQYNAKKLESVVNAACLGTIVVETTGEHTLRFECLTGRSGETSWDMLQFIPVDDDQIWPRIDIKGKLVYEDTPDCEIWPYNVQNKSNFQGDCVF